MAGNVFNERIIITGISREEVEVALGFIGSRGYHIEIEPIEENDNEHVLGFATLDELKEYAQSKYLGSPGSPHNAKQMPVKVWNLLMRANAVRDLNLFDEANNTTPGLNVDILAKIYDTNTRILAAIPGFGGAKYEFVGGFIESRRAALEQADQPQE